MNVCFENIIGVMKGCESTPSTSGLYLNKLAGISIKQTANIADGEEATGVSLMETAISQATDNALGYVQSELFKRNWFEFPSVLNVNKLGYDGNETYFPLTAENKGIYLQKTEFYKYAEIKINVLQIFVKDDALAKEIKIIDGSHTEIITADLIGGTTNTVYVNYTCKTGKVYIVMDNSDVQTKQTNVFQSNSGCRACGAAKMNNKYMFASGWTGSAYTSYSYGIFAEVALACDIQTVLCIFKSEFYKLIAYEAARLIFSEASIQKDRYNFVTLDKKTNQEAAAYYEMLIEKELERVLSVLNGGLNSINDPCVICKKIKMRNGV